MSQQYYIGHADHWPHRTVFGKLTNGIAEFCDYTWAVSGCHGVYQATNVSIRTEPVTRHSPAEIELEAVICSKSINDTNTARR